MSSQFTVPTYLGHLGEELISAYELGALASTPGTKGTSREVAVRKKLEQVLPEGIGVGSGFVIDSHGGISRQTDIVLFEANICPVFRLNESEDVAFYPCEGVFAVGEVKSHIRIKEVEDIVRKTRDVRKLRRVIKEYYDEYITKQKVVSHRGYGSRLSAAPGKEDSYVQDSRGIYQIYTFAIARSLDVNNNTLLRKVIGQANTDDRIFAVNQIVTLSGNVVKPLLQTAEGQYRIVHSAIEATGYAMLTTPNPFPRLVLDLLKAFELGRTVDADCFSSYMIDIENSSLPIDKYVEFTKFSTQRVEKPKL